MHNNNLVSKSPFKSQIPAPATPSLKPKPIAISFPTSSSRRVSGEKRQRPSSMHELAEHENSRPLALKRDRKQSKAFEVLYEKEAVSKSPFRVPGSGTASGSTSDDGKRASTSASTSSPVARPRPVSVAAPEDYLPPPRAPTPSRNTPSPGRSALVSRRMHGPRLSGSGRRERRKTVTFDERCDVVEFDRDEESGDDVFESSSEDGEDPQNSSMQLDNDQSEDLMPIQTPQEMLDEPIEVDEEGPDESSFESTSSHDEEAKKVDPLLALDPDASITGIVDNLFFSDNGHHPADHSLASVVSTPPRQSSLPPELETEDGVPLGRSHHVERFLQHHSPHLGPQRISPNSSPQAHSPGRYPFNLNLPTHASPNGPPATPPRRSPGMSHTTPPLGRSTHAERVKDAREQEHDDLSREVNNLPPSPSPMKPQAAVRQQSEEALIPRFDLGQGTSLSLEATIEILIILAEASFHDTNASPKPASAADPFIPSRQLDEASCSNTIDADDDLPEDDEAMDASFNASQSGQEDVDDLSRNEVSSSVSVFDHPLTMIFAKESAYLDAENGDDDQDISAATLPTSNGLTGTESPVSRSGSPFIRSGSPMTRLSSPHSTNGLQVNRPRISKDDVKRRLLGRRSLCSPSPEPTEQLPGQRPSSSLQNEHDPNHLAPLLPPNSPEHDRDKDRDRMSVLTTMTDMSTETAVVDRAERVAFAVGSLVSPSEAEEDREFGVAGTEDRLKFDFGSKFSLGGLGMSHNEEEDEELDSHVLSTSLTADADFTPSAGMRMGDQDVDMDMKSALDRLMEDVAGGRVDDSMMTDDSFVSHDSEMTDMSFPEPGPSRPKRHERSATDTMLLDRPGAGVSSPFAKGVSTSPFAPPVPPKDNIKAREQLILEKRRQARRLADGDSDSDDGDSPGPVPKQAHKVFPAGRARRSMSVGDADDLAAYQRDAAMLKLEEVQTDNLMGNIEKELIKMADAPEKKVSPVTEPLFACFLC